MVFVRDLIYVFNGHIVLLNVEPVSLPAEEPKKGWDFYFRAPGSLVVLSFLQPLNFSSVFSSL
jgi:hypothetical protein